MEDKEISQVAMYTWQLATALGCDPADFVGDLIDPLTSQDATKVLAEIDRLSNLEIDVVFLSSFVVKTGKGRVQDND